MSDRSYFVHPTALVHTDRIGAGTRIWAFCNVQQDVTIGAECNICDHCFIEQTVVVGDRVTVKNGVSLWEGVILEDDVFVGPNAVFTNDVRPRSKACSGIEPTVIKQGATIGANAVIVAGHTVGRYAFIGAGAVVTKNIPDFTLWFGNPARPVGYVCICARQIAFVGTETTARCSACGRQYTLSQGGVTLK